MYMSSDTHNTTGSQAARQPVRHLKELLGAASAVVDHDYPVVGVDLMLRCLYYVLCLIRAC